MLRQKKFRTVRMRRAAAKSKTQAERARWERLARKALASNDNRTLREQLRASLELERAKAEKPRA